MKIQHLIPILFLAAFCTVSAQTITTAPDGTTTTIFSTSSYIFADGDGGIAVGPLGRPTSPSPSVPIHTITATPTNGTTTVTLRSRTKDGKLPVDVSSIRVIRSDTPHSQDFTLGLLSFVGKDGDWTATNVAPVDYVVSLINTNYVEADRDFQTFRVEAGTNYTIEFVLSNGATFKGRVLDDATGKPIAGARVHGESETLSHYSNTDAEGRYELSHVIGGLKVDAWASNYVEQDFRLGAAGEDSTVSVPDIRLQRGGRISGRVERPANMEDNAHAFVSVEIQGSFPTNSVISGAYGGADGIFRTGPLPPGTCTLHAEWKPAFVPGNPVETWQAKGSVSGIKVIAGQNTTKVVIPIKLTIQTNRAAG